MAQEQTPQAIIGVWEMQHWLKFPKGNWIRVTENKTSETESEAKTYEPTYLDRKEQPVFTMGHKTKFSFEIDALAPGGIQQELAKYEDQENVAVEYMRTLGYDLVKGQPTPATSLIAKTCNGFLNMNQLKGEAGEPLVLSGEVSFNTAFKAGTFNPTSLEFSEKESV